MCILFGLILFNITWIYGEIIQCLYGDLNEMTCNTHITDSVIYKFYISNYGFKNKNNKKLDKRLDIPYRTFISNQDHTSISNNTQSYNKKHIVTYDQDDISPNVFLLSFWMGEYNPSDNYVHDENIKNCWNNLVLNGTDTDKLKFHSKIIQVWKIKQGIFSSDIKMIILNSFYNSANIHYFTKNNDIALQVAEEGLEYYQTIKHDIIEGKIVNEEIFMLWEILILSLKIDALGKANTSDLKQIKDEAIQYLKICEWMFNSYIEQKKLKFPTAYLLMYRRIILDNDIDSGYPSNIIDNIKTVSTNRVVDYRERNVNQVTYHLYFILMGVYNEYKTNGYLELGDFKSLLIALEKPILSTEDRLLNHKAVSIATSSISQCININGWITDSNNNICNKLSREQKYDPEPRIKRFLPKLINMQRYYHINHFNLESILFTNGLINEENVHMILTMTMDIEFITYYTKTELVLRSINIIENYYENYSLEESASGLVNMLKWLVELYGVLCNVMYKDGNTYNYQQRLHTYLDRAYIIHENHNLAQDEHLKFLVYKRSCSNLYQLFPWETKYRVTGWILNEKFDDVLVFDICNDVSTMTNTNNPFISYSDILILMYRYLMAHKHYDKAFIILNDLLKIPVITCEERARNQEVNELLSYHTLVDNYKTVMEQN